jgi:hypothetical protein
MDERDWTRNCGLRPRRKLECSISKIALPDGVPIDKVTLQMQTESEMPRSRSGAVAIGPPRFPLPPTESYFTIKISPSFIFAGIDGSGDRRELVKCEIMSANRQRQMLFPESSPA